MASHSCLNFTGIPHSCLTDVVNQTDDFHDESLNNIRESRYFDLDDMVKSFKNANNDFTVLSLNIQSIHAKWEIFSTTIDFLRSKGVNFSAILLQETWQIDGNSAYDIPGYVSFDEPRFCSTHSGLKTHI